MANFKSSQSGAATAVLSPSVDRSPASQGAIAWIELERSPYPLNQQVELLNLQAEAEALLLQLQSRPDRG
ncbi:MAG: hypothetical protein VKL98_01705 [Cyanobacteriota bacterium]|nr:hypothetical protein [Cyanobacteriota bacterium]